MYCFSSARPYLYNSSVVKSWRIGCTHVVAVPDLAAVIPTGRLCYGSPQTKDTSETDVSRQSATLGLVLPAREQEQSSDTSERWQGHWARFQEDVVVNTQLSNSVWLVTETKVQYIIICTSLPSSPFSKPSAPLPIVPIGMINLYYCLLTCHSYWLLCLNPLFVPLNDLIRIRPIHSILLCLHAGLLGLTLPGLSGYWLL